MATVIDAYSRRVIGGAIVDHMRINRIQDALVMAMTLRGERLEQVIFRSDDAEDSVGLRNRVYGAPLETALTFSASFAASLALPSSCPDARRMEIDEMVIGFVFVVVVVEASIATGCAQSWAEPKVDSHFGAVGAETGRPLHAGFRCGVRFDDDESKNGEVQRPAPLRVRPAGDAV